MGKVKILGHIFGRTHAPWLKRLFARTSTQPPIPEPQLEGEGPGAAEITV